MRFGIRRGVDLFAQRAVHNIFLLSLSISTKKMEIIVLYQCKNLQTPTDY